MMTCTLPSAVLSDYLSRRAQCFARILSLAKHHKPEGLQIGLDTSADNNYLQALRLVSDHIMRDSKEVVPVFAFTDSPLSSSSSTTTEKMQQFLLECTANSVEAINPCLYTRDFMEAEIRNFLLLAHSGTAPNSKEELQSSPMMALGPQRLRKILATVLECEMAFLRSTLGRNASRSEFIPLGLAESTTGGSERSPWHPSNIIFATDYDLTCTLFDSCYFMLQGDEGFEPGMLRYEELQLKIYSSLGDPEKIKDTDSTYWREREHSEKKFLSGFDPSMQPVSKSFELDESIEGDEEISGIYDEAGLRRALVKLANLEEICNADIMSVGFLKGATREEIQARAKNVTLRPQCAEVMQKLVRAGTSIHLVSANWSRDIILGGLPDLPEDKLLLHCNELNFDSNGFADGTFDNTCVDAFDKEKMLRTLRRMASSETASISGENIDPESKMLVFMGDSPTDLLGLLEADLGIVFGESSRLRQLLSLYNIQLLPLAAATADILVARYCGSKWSYRRSGVLFKAEGWEDVEACLFGQLEIAEKDSTTPFSSSDQKHDNVMEDEQGPPGVEFEDWSRDLLMSPMWANLLYSSIEELEIQECEALTGTYE
ncbi:hypothetical protein R1sor_022855 [Riccia sorocarpa]|uniref:Uncharacterized protein n=1 Tax=Riccia sorocarpa TaxID=122646 RepID=A0ABD3GQ93_9MARC